MYLQEDAVLHCGFYETFIHYICHWNTHACNLFIICSFYFLIGSKHEDGTQSDSENGLGLRFANRRNALEERLKATHSNVGGGGVGGAGGTGVGNITVSGARTTGSRTAFMIEFYDEENPRKRRSYSFSQTAPLLGGGTGGEGLCPQPPAHPKVFSISTSATTASDSGKNVILYHWLYLIWLNVICIVSNNLKRVQCTLHNKAFQFWW